MQSPTRISEQSISITLKLLHPHCSIIGNKQIFTALSTVSRAQGQIPFAQYGETAHEYCTTHQSGSTPTEFLELTLILSIYTECRCNRRPWRDGEECMSLFPLRRQMIWVTMESAFCLSEHFVLHGTQANSHQRMQHEVTDIFMLAGSQSEGGLYSTFGHARMYNATVYTQNNFSNTMQNSCGS